MMNDSMLLLKTVAPCYILILSSNCRLPYLHSTSLGLDYRSGEPPAGLKRGLGQLHGG